MRIGTGTPPSAATPGTARRRRCRSSPRSSCRLASRPTTRKNRVIKPSLTQWRRSVAISVLPIRIARFVVQTDSYECHPGAFAHTSAAIAAPSITIAPPSSVLRKLRTGAARFRAQAVRPPYVTASVSTLIEGSHLVTTRHLLLAAPASTLTLPACASRIENPRRESRRTAAGASWTHAPSPRHWRDAHRSQNACDPGAGPGRLSGVVGVPRVRRYAAGEPS